MRNEELEKDDSYLSILYKESWLKFYERWLFSEERKNEHKAGIIYTNISFKIDNYRKYPNLVWS